MKKKVKNKQPNKSPNCSVPNRPNPHRATQSSTYTEDLITVHPTSFRFQHTFVQPRLIFGDRQRFFMGNKEWFQSEILQTIDREFTIRLFGYDGFAFVPFQDEEVFRNMLIEKYEEYTNQEREKILLECSSKVKEYFDIQTSLYLRKFKHFNINVRIEDFVYHEEREFYSLRVNCLTHLKLNPESLYKISIPFNAIKKLFNSKILEKYEDYISEKWGSGVSSTFSVSNIFPNMKSLICEMKIPAIYLEKERGKGSISIYIHYNESRGRFEGELEYIHSSSYKTMGEAIVFDDSIKEALKTSIKNIKTPFIETFYSAYVYMFKEGDKSMREIRDKILKKYRRSGYRDEYRYHSGISPLQKFNANDYKDWLWLSDKIKSGVFEAAYCFTDKDETLSSRVGYTKKYPVKIYLTVHSDKEVGFTSDSLRVPRRMTISLYALDSAKSIYRFRIDADRLQEAVFFLWSYFSSNNYNKRQDFEEVLDHKQNFGIHFFYKDPPLTYKSGLGYIDSEWDQKFY